MSNTTTRSDQLRGEIPAAFPQRKAFVLQFSADAGPQTGLFRGRIEHVTTGDQASFASTEELWAFVGTILTRRSSAEEPGALPSAGAKAA